MRPLSDRQTVEAALEVWAAAERQQLGVVADDNGVIELLYASVQIQAPDVASSLTKAAVLKLVDRIQSELTRRAALSELGSAESLIAKIPSLGRFAATGKLGHLREEWEQLTHRNAISHSILPPPREGSFALLRVALFRHTRKPGSAQQPPTRGHENQLSRLVRNLKSNRMYQ